MRRPSAVFLCLLATLAIAPVPGDTCVEPIAPAPEPGGLSSPRPYSPGYPPPPSASRLEVRHRERLPPVERPLLPSHRQTEFLRHYRYEPGDRYRR